MLTTMTDADWTTVLKVFEVSRSRRGDKGRDDKTLPASEDGVVVLRPLRERANNTRLTSQLRDRPALPAQ